MIETKGLHQQYIGKADNRPGKSREKPILPKETGASPEQTQFFNRYQRELDRAQAAERQANQEARDRMKGLTAPELRNIGFKQVLWGTALSLCNGVGIGMGLLGGFGVWAGTGWLAVSAASAGSAIAGALGVAAFASVAAVPLGFIGGAVAGSELARYVYNRFARKVDASLPALDKTDRVVGDLLAVSGLANPPMVSGMRNIFQGFSQIKVLK